MFFFPQLHQKLFDLAAAKITNLKKKDLDDKFIICLNKISKHFPPFMDRYVLGRLSCVSAEFQEMNDFFFFFPLQVCEPRFLSPAEVARRPEDVLLGVRAEPSRRHPGHFPAAQGLRLHPDDRPQVWCPASLIPRRCFPVCAPVIGLRSHALPDLHLPGTKGSRESAWTSSTRSSPS